MNLRIMFISFVLALLAPASVASGMCTQTAGSPEWARCNHLRAFEYFGRGDWDAAAAGFHNAVTTWRQLGEQYRPALARSLDMLGESRAAQERWTEAELAYRESISAAGSSSVAAAGAQSRLAYVLVREGRPEEARQIGHEALPKLASGSVERPMLMHVLASVEPASARRWLSEAVSEIIAYGKPHPALARILEDYASVLIQDRNVSRALPLLRRAEAMYERGDSRRLRVRQLIATLEAPDRRRHEVSLALLSK
jgi:tetratricopeptide (TPR) repeat protein